jgi:hypothetical protein
MIMAMIMMKKMMMICGEEGEEEVGDLNLGSSQNGLASFRILGLTRTFPFRPSLSLLRAISFFFFFFIITSATPSV